MSRAIGLIFRLLSLQLLIVPTVCYAQQALIPLENFVKEDQYSNPSLSPDGKYLAVTERIPDKERFVPVIVVFSLPEMKQQSAVRMPVFEVPHSYTWVTNTRLLVTKAKEVGSKEQPSLTGEIFAMDFDGENQQYIYGYNAYMTKVGAKYGDNRGTGRIVGFPTERNGHFYMSTSMWEGERTMLYDVDAKNGNRKLIATLPISGVGFLLQNDGKPRFAFGANQSNIANLYRFDEGKDEWLAQPKEKDVHSFTPLAFTDDDKAFYAYISKEGEPAQLVLQNVETGERNLVAENKRASLNLVEYSYKNGIPFAVASHLGIPRFEYLDKTSPESALHQLLNTKFAGNVVEFINYTDDGSKLLFSVRSDREPGSYFIFDRKNNRAYPLFASKQYIEPEQMAERRPIRYTSRDGVEIDGYLTLPKQIDFSKKLPMVVLPHGGPHGPFDKWFYDNDAQFLASRGYSVLQVNFRGSGGKGSKFEESGWKKWGAEIQNDILDGVQWAIKEANIDAKRICTYGASFGGYSALMLAVREPDMFKCAIGYVGVYDLNLMFTSEEAKNQRFKATMTRYLGSDQAQFDQFSPAKHADKIKIPVMLAHGMEDTRATFNHAEAMRDALIKVGRPPEWMAVPNEGHGFYNTKNVLEFYSRLSAFLAKHLGE